MRIILAALALLAAFAAPAGAECRADRVAFRTARGDVSFAVEIARTDAERARGLMGRKHLAPGAGMLFLYRRPGTVAFWMHDTLIPLDMIFLDAAGRVTRVHADARPLDDTVIAGGDAVLAVVEINAGAAKAAGIVPGVAMRSPLMPQAPAAWPCAGP